MLSHREAELLQRNRIVEDVAARRPQHHELRSGDSLLRPVPDEPPPAAEAREIEDPDEHALRTWKLSERYELIC